MRWYWIDKFVEFESGSYARAVKNVTLAEEHLHDHFPGFPVMPASLMVEGMAQTGGILLGEKFDFEHIVILAKVPKITFHSWACPGDSVIYHAKLIDAKEEGGSVEVTAHVGDRLVADGEIVFVHLAQDDPEMGKIDQKNFVFSSNLMDIFESGRAGDGT
ncbi:MAG: 3-hydroxyacyl-ACP dehydratase FabZ family protein [Planctomycetaceae bacterium]